MTTVITSSTCGTNDGTSLIICSSNPVALSGPSGVAADPNSGVVYVADTGNSIVRQISVSGT